MTSPAAATRVTAVTGGPSSRNVATAPPPVGHGDGLRRILDVGHPAARRERVAASTPSRSSMTASRFTSRPREAAERPGRRAASNARRVARAGSAATVAAHQPDATGARGVGGRQRLRRPSAPAPRRRRPPARRRRGPPSASSERLTRRPARRTRWVGSTGGASAHVVQQRQHVVPGRVALAGPVRGPLGAVAQRGLVAVVAVGDGQRAGRPASAAARAPSPIGLPRPRRAATGTIQTRGATPSSVVATRPGRERSAGRASAGRRPGPASGAAPRGEVHAGRLEQPVAVLLGPGHRPLVGPHPAVGPERLEPQPREDPPGTARRSQPRRPGQRISWT